MQSETISLAGIDIELTRKRVKNVNLRVGRDGKVLVSASKRVPLAFIAEFVANKKDWILQRKKESALRKEKRHFNYTEGELHLIWGRSLPIRRHHAAQTSLICSDHAFELSGPANLQLDAAEHVFNNWYRIQIKKQLPALFAHWQPIVGASANQWGVKKMRTKWGTCNIQAARIWLNLELVKYERACLEYVVVHELTHLHERYHNTRFYTLLDQYMPEWRRWDEALNDYSL